MILTRYSLLRILATLAVLIVLAWGLWGWLGPQIRYYLVEEFNPNYQAMGDPSDLTPQFLGKDSDRRQIDISLEVILEDLKQPTDIQFPPDRAGEIIILEKGGLVKWFDLNTSQERTILELDVTTASEQGLLGLAFHPEFNENGRIFINKTVKDDGHDFTRIVEYHIEEPHKLERSEVKKVRVLLEVEQPYANHNAGQLAFGPQGKLFIGLGDGGWKGDPHDHAQNRGTKLGNMLRIDIDDAEGDQAYKIPKDNPFVDEDDILSEIWAWGFRNPWRYSFDSKGRLFVADVGQDKWEWIHIVEPGKNYGWPIREGLYCYRPKEDCPTEGIEDPIYTYSHDEGSSITGGFVYTGQRIDELDGKYIFGDFVQGKLWALDTTQDLTGVVSGDDIYSLGQWPLLISTFGQDQEGEIYFGDFGSGTIYQIAPPIEEDL